MRLAHISSGCLRAPGVARLVAAGLLAITCLHDSGAWAQDRPQSRGELLYNTNCVACHNEKMHWRGRKLVYDWDSLEEQVRRWQQASSLGWRDEDITEVARYLNARFYGFTPANRLGSSHSRLGDLVPAVGAVRPGNVATPMKER